jgi:RNA polymerase sigma-70 factor (ECF subfamily)
MILAAAIDPDVLPTHDAIARLRRGDLDGLAELLPQYQLRLYRFLLRIVQDPALAEDLFQQTWLRVVEKISLYEGRRPFDSWLFSVAHNLAVDHLRRRRGVSLDDSGESGQAPVDRLPARGDDPLERVLEYERAAILAEAMQLLPVIHREVLTLRFEEGMPLEQIAEVAAIPLSTVKSRLHRAIENLRKEVEGRLRP